MHILGYMVLCTCVQTESRGIGLRYLEIAGGVPLHGEIAVQGSKNAVLPVLAACLLGDGVCVLENCPVISDVEDTLKIMETLGCRVSRAGGTVRVDASCVNGTCIEGPEAARIRSSILFLGALLGKMGEAVLPRPGGCAIGERPIDQHLSVLQQLGADVTVGETISATGSNLRGGHVKLAIPSVGATENAVLASVMADGETVIENAAREPEIDELCTFLNLRGARISRRPDGSIRICGTAKLFPVSYTMRADRIVTGTYLLAAAATGGSIRIRNFPHGELDALLQILGQMGTGIGCFESELVLESDGMLCAVPYVETAPYPGFPTDLQSPLMAVLCRADGRSCICETIFENRFRTAQGLCQMGASVEVKGRCAWIDGRKKLYGASLEAPDLRGGAALVIAALQADGCSVINGIGYIERGYEDIAGDLRALGAAIEVRETETAQ